LITTAEQYYKQRKKWQAELLLLRSIVLDCHLTEELKWQVPVYTYLDKNIVIVYALKESCGISFLKGGLLKDEHGILKKPGENTQAVRLIRFNNIDDIHTLKSVITDYIFEALEMEESGVKVDTLPKAEAAIPVEFQKRLDENPDLADAFFALTPGRRRAYLLYFCGAKQAITRETRIEKYIPLILAGRGIND